MSSKIKHAGVIDSIVGRNVKVRIVQTSACAACKVASHCNASESKVKLVDVTCDSGTAARLRTGQEVVVSTTTAMVGNALLLGFGIPLLLLLGTLVMLIWLSYGEGTAALASIAVLLPYYLLLWALHDRIGKRITFQLEE